MYQASTDFVFFDHAKYSSSSLAPIRSCHCNEGSFVNGTCVYVRVYVCAYTRIPLIDRLITISTRMSFHGYSFSSLFCKSLFINIFAKLVPCYRFCSYCKHTVIWWRFQIIFSATAINGKRGKRMLDADNDHPHFLLVLRPINATSRNRRVANCY